MQKISDKFYYLVENFRKEFKKRLRSRINICTRVKILEFLEKIDGNLEKKASSSRSDE